MRVYKKKKNNIYPCTRLAEHTSIRSTRYYKQRINTMRVNAIRFTNFATLLYYCYIHTARTQQTVVDVRYLRSFDSMIG